MILKSFTRHETIVLLQLFIFPSNNTDLLGWYQGVMCYLDSADLDYAFEMQFTLLLNRVLGVYLFVRRCVVFMHIIMI